MPRYSPHALAALTLVCATLLPVSRLSGQEREPSSPETERLFVDVSGRLINAAIQKTVDRTEPSFEIINEVPVLGTKRTVGKVWTELIPDPCRGIMDIVFEGTVYSCGVGHRMFTFVHTSTVAPFSVRLRVVFSPTSISALRGPAGAWANITLLGVTGKDGDPYTTAAQIVRAGFPQEKEELEGIVSRLTVVRVHEGMEMESSLGLYKTSRAIGKGVLCLKSIGLPVESLKFQATTSHFHSRLGVHVPNGIKVLPAPKLQMEDDLTVRLHESLLNQTATVALKGKSVQLSDLHQNASEILGLLLRDSRDESERVSALELIDKLAKKLTGKSPTLTMAQEDPLTLRFRGDTIRLEGHISSFQFSDSKLAGIQVHAEYHVTRNAAGNIDLVRKGPVRLEDSDAPESRTLPKLDPAQSLLVGSILSEVFKSHFALTELDVPGTLESVSPLSLSRVETESGWLTIAWRRDLKRGK